MELTAVTGQLYLINGEVQATDGVPGLWSQGPPPRAARGRSRDYLFIHLTLSGPAAETEVLAQDLLDTISSHYYRTPGSVTAALRQAIIDCNDLLLRRNVSGTDASREGALSCVVLRQNELYMAQTGESFAVLGHRFGVQRIPPALPDRTTPLGRSAGLDIRLYHHWLEPGHSLLLADPRMAHLPAEALQPVLVDSDVVDGLALLQRKLSADTARAMLISFSDEEPLALPASMRQPTAQKLSPPTRRPRSDSIQPGPGRPSRPTLSIGLSPARPPAVGRAARQATSQAAIGLGRASGWLALLLERIHPRRAPEPPAQVQAEAEAQRWAVPLLLAILIPLLVAGVVTGVYLQRGNLTRFNQLRVDMTHNMNQAESAEASQARALYQQVLQLASEAEALRPDNAEVNRMRQEALRQLDRLDGTGRLTGHTLYDFGPEARLTGVVLRSGLNGDIYTLDAGTGQAYLLETDESFLQPTGTEPAVLAFKSQAIGSHIVGNILDIVWRDKGSASNREGLGMLDGSGAFITYDPTFRASQAAPLGLASQWLVPAAAVMFSERLYVLDRGARTVWRYFPEGSGFTIKDGQESLSFIEDVELNKVVDLAIYSEDGSVLLLYEDGRLRRYGNGRLMWDEASLAANGLPSPLVAPVALKIIGRGLNSSIFVADPGTARVVQISLAGIFLAQYKASDEDGSELFAKLSDFDVASEPLRIFTAAGSRLVAATGE